MKKTIFHNPVIKGGYPDPSVCRVGDIYYMVTSSFSYFPGLPLFRSTDLVHWEQIGNAISRPGQLDYRDCGSSEGLWAATIRYHNGTFYIVNTLDVQGRTYRYNYIITASDPAGEWSDAVLIRGADGIDPSLYFDDNGKIWYCANMIPETLCYPSHKLIYLCELDPVTFQFAGERRIIYDGNIERSLFMEAPHIYHINKMYYLMTACGGTQTNHCVNISRSKSLFGPYEPCPRNPIVTNRGLRLINSLGVAVTGHGDLIHTQTGEWYMALLGIRPYEKEIEDYDRFLPRQWIRTPDRNKNAQFNLGREVFLIPIAWDYDGWPLVDNENGMVNLIERRPKLPVQRPPLSSRMDNFEDPQLDMIWCMRRPVQTPFYSLTERPGFLRLYLTPMRLEDAGTPAMLVRRQQHYDFQISLSMEFEPMGAEEAGLVLTQNERFAFLLVKTAQSGRSRIEFCRIVCGKREFVAAAENVDGKVYLFAEGSEGSYDFYYGHRERERIPLALGVDGSLLSTVVADGFVGTYVGMYAAGGRAESSERYAEFDWFKYEIIEE